MNSNATAPTRRNLQKPRLEPPHPAELRAGNPMPLGVVRIWIGKEYV